MELALILKVFQMEMVLELHRPPLSLLMMLANLKHMLTEMMKLMLELKVKLSGLMFFKELTQMVMLFKPVKVTLWLILGLKVLHRLENITWLITINILLS